MASFFAPHYPKVLGAKRLVHEPVNQWISGSRHEHQVIVHQMYPSRQENVRHVKRPNHAQRNP